ncbi:MAG: hypothetical protein PHW73_04145 [Atribacterota bacterium]|nr:hypothetical protein [Atribacterota bacterium]
MIDKIKGRTLFDKIPREKRLQDYTEKEREIWIKAGCLYWGNDKEFQTKCWDLGVKQEKERKEKQRLLEEKKKHEEQEAKERDKQAAIEAARPRVIYIREYCEPERCYSGYEIPPLPRKNDYYIDENGRTRIYDGFDNPGPDYDWVPSRRY